MEVWLEARERMDIGTRDEGRRILQEQHCIVKARNNSVTTVSKQDTWQVAVGMLAR